MCDTDIENFSIVCTPLSGLR